MVDPAILGVSALLGLVYLIGAVIMYQDKHNKLIAHTTMSVLFLLAIMEILVYQAGGSLFWFNLIVLPLVGLRVIRMILIIQLK